MIKCQECNAYWIIPEVKYENEAVEIINKCCDYFKIPLLHFLSKRRYRGLAIPRFMIYHVLLSNKELGVSFSEVGRLFKKDHTSIMHGIKSIVNNIITDSKIEEDLKNLHIYIYGHLNYFYDKKENN